MYAPNSSILHDKEQTGRIPGTRRHYLDLVYMEWGTFLV